jgi:hypothetical protein
MFRLLAQAMDTLHVKVSNVHIRYEDGDSDPASPFSAGIMLDSLEFQTADMDWKVSNWTKGAELVHKILQVSGFAIYWQHNLKQATDRASMIRTNMGGTVPDPAAGAYHVLDPWSFRARLGLNRGAAPPDTQTVPRVSVDVEASRVQLRADCSMLRDVGILVEAAALHANRRRVADAGGGGGRPTTPCRGNAGVWWRYSIRCVASEVRRRRDALRPESVRAAIRRAAQYLPLFQRRLAGGDDVGGGLSEDELARLAELEREMPIHAVMALRGRAEDVVGQERTRARAGEATACPAAPGGGGGLLDRLLRGWKRVDAGATVRVGVAWSACRKFCVTLNVMPLVGTQFHVNP